jgi:hypothetical protein
MPPIVHEEKTWYLSKEANLFKALNCARISSYRSFILMWFLNSSTTFLPRDRSRDGGLFLINSKNKN